jgi:hypothetical protein
MDKIISKIGKYFVFAFAVHVTMLSVIWTALTSADWIVMKSVLGNMRKETYLD